MHVNYFLAAVGETLQRMGGSDARYSIALLDMPQYRRLRERLLALAKMRTQIGAAFVEDSQSFSSSKFTVGTAVCGRRQFSTLLSPHV